VINCIKIISTA